MGDKIWLDERITVFELKRKTSCEFDIEHDLLDIDDDLQQMGVHDFIIPNIIISKI